MKKYEQLATEIAQKREDRSAEIEKLNEAITSKIAEREVLASGLSTLESDVTVPSSEYVRAVKSIQDMDAELQILNGRLKKLEGKYIATREDAIEDVKAIRTEQAEIIEGAKANAIKHLRNAIDVINTAYAEVYAAEEVLSTYNRYMLPIFIDIHERIATKSDNNLDFSMKRLADHIANVIDK